MRPAPPLYPHYSPHSAPLKFGRSLCLTHRTVVFIIRFNNKAPMFSGPTHDGYWKRYSLAYRMRPAPPLYPYYSPHSASWNVGDLYDPPFKRRAYYCPPDATFYILFSTNISTEYFKHAAHSPFFSSKCFLFHNATFFCSCIIYILHTDCAKI
jgi:hypothetical protein